MNNFERGFKAAVNFWRAGMTLESITYRASRMYVDQGFETSRGMIAAVDAMSGWLDLARREAKWNGISDIETERLIDLARVLP